MEHIYLSHHGIKGQKWGVRRFQLKNGRLTAAGKKRYADDDDEQKKTGEEESTPKKRSVSEMSDQELREAINRAQLENQYRQYVEGPQKQKPSEFREAVESAGKKILVDPAINAASRYVSTKMNKTVDKLAGGQAKSIKELLNTDISKMSVDELRKVVDYKDLTKRYKEHEKNESDEARLNRVTQERMDKRKRQIDMEQQELNLRMKRATVEKMEEDRRKARETAAQTVADVVNDMGSENVSSAKGVTGMRWGVRSSERGKTVVDQYLDEPLMLPAPKDDLEHSDILEHHGIKGQKWGVRRFQRVVATAEKYADKYADAVLKDCDITITDAGREWVKKNMLRDPYSDFRRVEEQD